MFINLRIVFAMLLFVPLTSGAKTVIVTHAETGFDHQRVAGLSTRTLLNSPSFNRKIILSSGGTLTFPKDALNLQYRSSDDGRFLLDFDEVDFTLAGGYFGACLHNSVLNIIGHASADTTVTFKMNAIYLVGPLDVPPGETVTTLSHLEEKYGQELLVSMIKENGDRLAQELVAGRPKTMGFKSRTDFILRILIHGKYIGSIGNGSMTINLKFE